MAPLVRRWKRRKPSGATNGCESMREHLRMDF
jgi:hypothetical protein